MKLAAMLSVLAAVVIIVSASLGGHIYRWEVIVSAAVTIIWTVNALIFWRLSENV